MIGIRERLEDQFRVDNRTATMLLVLAGITLVAIALGFWIDPKDFALNLLAGGAGLGVAVIAGVLLFDKLQREAADREQERRLAAQEEQRRKRWEGARTATLTALWDQLRVATIPIVARSPSARTVSTDYKNVLKLLERVAAWIPTQAVRIDSAVEGGLQQYEADKAAMRLLYTDVVRGYAYIRDVLTPRVFELADDERLIGLLFDLDAMERMWSDRVFIVAEGEVEGPWRDFPVSAWNAVLAFHEAAVEVGRHVSSTPDLPPPHPVEAFIVGDGKDQSVRARTVRNKDV